MGQSSELEWAHKKIKQQYVSSPIINHNIKIKLTLIYDIIKLIM